MNTSPYVTASAASTRTEKEARRERAIAQVRCAAIQDGLSARLADEVAAEMRMAFHQADTLDFIFGNMGLK